MDANAKRMHHRFHWRAPTGLGRVTFRLLLKWGETNGGNFYWPMTEGDLTLDEGAIVPDANASRAPSPCCLRCVLTLSHRYLTAISPLSHRYLTAQLFGRTPLMEAAYVSGRASRARVGCTLLTSVSRSL